MKRQALNGFTLVELIVVIILVAIVSLYAASRYIGKDSFAAFVAQEQVISVIRQIQVSRMQSNLADGTSSDAYTLTVQPTCVGSVAGCSSTADGRSDWVAESGVTFLPLTSRLEFNLLGEPDQVITVRIMASGSQCNVNIAANGYVSKGSCL